MMISLQLIFGLFLGYACGSFIEAIIHRYILHAPQNFLKYWKKHYKLFGFLYREYEIHKIHHYQTFRINTVTQFENENERLKLNDRLSLRGIEFVRHVERVQYGLRAQPSMLLPVSILISIIFGIPIICILGNWVFLGSIPFMYFLPYFMSRVLHPFSHMSYKQALSKSSSPIIRFIIRTNAYKYLIDRFIHHQYISCNYNLILGADYFLKWNRKISFSNQKKDE